MQLLFYVLYLFEGEPKDGNFLAGDGAEQGLDDSSGEPGLLVVVYVHDSLPVCGLLVQAQVFAQVDQVENVFLKARSSKADRGLEKLGPDPGVGPNGGGYLEMSNELGE